MLNQDFKNYLSQKISIFFKEKQEVLSASPVHGGSINSCFQLITNKGRYFIKTNVAEKYPGMFEAESKGLDLLKSTHTFRIPDVHFTGDHRGQAFILMEYISSSASGEANWEEFGISLSKLHQQYSTFFGLEYDNYIGSLPQLNKNKNNWAEFFIENRLMVQQKSAMDSKRIDSNTSKMLDKLYSKMEQLFPNEKPSLLHGDLWSGNFLNDENGKPVIVDPAVYYGHREMDIAMSKLFGGFNDQMYRNYNQEFPLENGWQERLDLCNLYPIMVHVNLFGGSYATQCKQILQRFI